MRYDTFFLYIIKMYVYFTDFLIYVLPKYILISYYNHEKFKVYKYIYCSKSNNKFYNIKTINDIGYSEASIIKNRNLINHCCIINQNGKYVKDITEDIRQFLHYNNNKFIKWEHILTHLDIYIDDTIVLHLNNDNLDECDIVVNTLIKNKCLFNIN